MNRFSLLVRLLVRAAWVRKDRALTAVVSAAVVAAIATAALTVYTDLENKLSREFRGFGANVVVTRQQGSLSQDDLAKITRALGSKAQVAPIAYAIASGPGGSRVVIAGTEIGAFREMNSWWSIQDSGHPNTQVL